MRALETLGMGETTFTSRRRRACRWRGASRRRPPRGRRTAAATRTATGRPCRTALRGRVTGSMHRHRHISEECQRVSGARLKMSPRGVLGNVSRQTHGGCVSLRWLCARPASAPPQHRAASRACIPRTRSGYRRGAARARRANYCTQKKEPATAPRRCRRYSSTFRRSPVR